MHFNTFVVVAAFVAGSASAAALPNPGHFGTTNIVGSNTGVGPIDIANVGDGNSQGPTVAGDDVNSFVAGKIRRAKSSSQPSYIASPQLSNEGSCNVGTAQCCQSLHQSQDLKSQGIFGSLLGAAIPLDNLMVGLQCNPLAQTLPILSGASTCQSQPVCCTGNKFDGLLSIGCSPLSLS